MSEKTISELKSTYRTLLDAFNTGRRIPDKTYRWLHSQYHDTFWKKEHALQVEPTIDWNIYQMLEIVKALAREYDVDISKVSELKQ